VSILWTARCASRGITVLALGITLALVAIGLGSVIALAGSTQPTWVGWLIALIGIAVGGFGWMMSSLTATLTATNFVVAFGRLGWPRRVIALADISDASAIVVEPLQWGGWGYRWVPWARASAAVIRRGPGIALVLRDGRRFAVTVEDAVTGAKATSEAISGPALP